MNDLLLFTLALAVGLAGLIAGARRFIAGASATARHLGISPLVIGLTVVALGTSSPEIFTSAIAAIRDSPDIAIGNVLGSNIANTGIILGLVLLIRPVPVPALLLKRDIPWLLLASFSVLLLFHDDDLDRLDGALLLAMLLIYFWSLVRSEMADQEESAAEHATAESGMSLAKALLLMLFALVVMVLGSNLVVWGARNLALALGLSELLVGLTLVAIGTSLPELATSIAGAMKGQHAIALGNIIGSNILNILAVLLFPAFASQVSIDPLVRNRDLPAMLAITLLLSFLLLLASLRKKPPGRKSGTVLIAFYFAYTALLISTQLSL